MFPSITLVAIVISMSVADLLKRDTLPQTELAQPAAPAFRARPPLTPKQADHIKNLIARLKEVNHPDYGYAQTLQGLAFPPVPGHAHVMSMTWTNHGLRTSQTLRELVALGPDALPFLLDALGDKTPTQLTFSHCGGIGTARDGTAGVIREGCTWVSNELRIENRLNPQEARFFQQHVEKPKESEHIDTYQVKVGDLCFVAIGQIVGRPYVAARYQMTSCTVINSPIEDAKLRDKVRQIWGSQDSVRTLYDSLWADYRTTAIPQGPDLDWWSFGSRFQTRAALRLLYYFPDQSAPVIAARLRKLNVAKTTEGEKDFKQQGVANGGVYADEFVHAVAWCKVPEVREAVRGIFQRTTDPLIFTSTLAIFNDTDVALIIKTTDELLSGLTPEELKAGNQFQLLSAVADRFGPATLPTYRRIIAKSDANALSFMIHTLRQTEGEWRIALLHDLLNDQRPTKYDYSVYEKGKPQFIPAPDEDDGSTKVPVRVCDTAAELLAKLIPGEKFPTEHDRNTLDRYIAKLKSKLATK